MQLLFDNGQEAPLLGVEQAVGAHLLEAAWKHVLDEPGDGALGGLIVYLLQMVMSRLAF